MLHLTLLIMKKLIKILDRYCGMRETISGVFFILFEKPCSICTNSIYFLSRAKSFFVVFKAHSLGQRFSQSTQSLVANYPKAWVDISYLCADDIQLYVYGIQIIWRDIQIWCYFSDRGLCGRHTDMDKLFFPDVRWWKKNEHIIIITDEELSKNLELWR